MHDSLHVQLAQPLLAASGQSSIVLISSVAGGPASIKSGTLYAMSKGAACWLCHTLSACMHERIASPLQLAVIMPFLPRT